MSRPCGLDTVQFRRVLNDAQRQIMLSAGQGDLTEGFAFLLEVYAHLHNQGFRPEDGLSGVKVFNYQDQNAIE
jgi:hypothetical protein